jgi:hypothetical protein
MTMAVPPAKVSTVAQVPIVPPLTMAVLPLIASTRPPETVTPSSSTRAPLPEATMTALALVFLTTLPWPIVTTAPNPAALSLAPRFEAYLNARICLQRWN